MPKTATDGSTFAFPERRSRARNAEVERLKNENVRLRRNLVPGKRVLEDLLAAISHEFRTPLTVIQGYTEILLDSANEPASRAFLDDILESCGQLRRLVEQAITLGRLHSGMLSMAPEPIGLREAVDRALARSADAISDKALVMVRRFPPDLPLVWMDGIYLDAVLGAVVENAVKFNKQAGRVELSARARRAAVELRVSNTGIGIPREEFARIFEVFDQVDSGATRNHGGLGLGLPLARRLLALAGGGIGVSSPGPRRGAAFTLTLPRDPSP
ncbi:MAG: HAMP domain-containing histidine kinase [Candidatus Sericytochromatia bacterium]|nr:HAMP domain-containing histidine kinase [Candidatus Tanganyikabacteria bacterium]